MAAELLIQDGATGSDWMDPAAIAALSVLVGKDEDEDEHEREEGDAAPRLRPLPPVVVEAGAVASVPVVVVAPRDTHGRHEIRFVITGIDSDVRKHVDSSFFGPM